MLSVTNTRALSLAAYSCMIGSSEVVGLYRTRSTTWSGLSFLVLTLS